jgi:hypothetical protein
VVARACVSTSWEVVILVRGSWLSAVKAAKVAARGTPSVLAAILAACAVVSCSGQAPGHAASSAPPPDKIATGAPLTQATWMLTRSALQQMLSDSAVRVRLERTRIYELLQPGQRPLSGVDATPVVTYSSVPELSSALADNTLPAGTGAVLYDPEAWSYTPADEQHDPVQAATQAARLAHAHGLKIIVAPALNLTTVLDPGSSAPRWRTFLNLGLAGPMAKVADTVELQAQSLERDPAAYATFVREAAVQARDANPNVTVLAGLSTNPPGAAVDSQQLTGAIEASRADVDGYWLNIPGQGPRCPTCNAPRPDLGVAVLSAVL